MVYDPVLLQIGQGAILLTAGLAAEAFPELPAADLGEAVTARHTFRQERPEAMHFCVHEVAPEANPGQLHRVVGLLVDVCVTEADGTGEP